MAVGQFASAETAEMRLISIDELAQLLDLSTRSVWRLRSAGQLPEPVRLGGAVRWRLDEVKQWIADGCPARPKPR
jgi:excisionase family DNA binding protein